MKQRATWCQATPEVAIPNLTPALTLLIVKMVTQAPTDLPIQDPTVDEATPIDTVVINPILAREAAGTNVEKVSRLKVSILEQSSGVTLPTRQLRIRQQIIMNGCGGFITLLFPFPFFFSSNLQFYCNLLYVDFKVVDKHSLL